METIQRFIEIPLEEIQTGDLTKDRTTYNCCLICGKALKAGIHYRMVHLLSNGNIVSYAGSDVDNSQGFFPVGNECVKRLVINFAF